MILKVWMQWIQQMQIWNIYYRFYFNKQNVDMTQICTSIKAMSLLFLRYLSDSMSLNDYTFHWLYIMMQNKLPASSSGCSLTNSVAGFPTASEMHIITTEQSTARRKTSRLPFLSQTLIWTHVPTHMHPCQPSHAHMHMQNYAHMYQTARTCPHTHTTAHTHTLGSSHSHFAPIEYMSVHLGSLTLC